MQNEYGEELLKDKYYTLNSKTVNQEKRGLIKRELKAMEHI